MERWVLALGCCGSVLAASVVQAGTNPLEHNLRALEQRAKTAKTRPVVSAKPAPARPAARAAAPVVRAAPRRPVRVVRVRPKPAVAAVRRPAPNRTASSRPAASQGPVSYARNRIGVKARGGDLVVQAFARDSATHVYLEQRLVSQGGNGFARVPDLSPGKYPVLVWAPDAGKRRTFWVTIRPGAVAALKASL